MRSRVGVNATGQPFNAIAAVERDPSGGTNPMVNSGALATTRLAADESTEGEWAFLRDGLSRFAGRELTLDVTVYASAVATNHRNRAIAALLQSMGGIAEDSRAVTELYTRQSCLRATAVDLAVMGATLADVGVTPRTGVTVVDADVARATLAVMTIAGLYETSGDWLLDVGLPARAGSAAESSPCLRARAGWARMRHRSTPPATASGANSRPPTWRAGSDSISWASQPAGPAG